ncbi:MAG: hypothetical protein M1832_005024 [Thelocarpon impressellum]|nr:MAG: hypothetical protein M1832_005024 [Thelocarpon impressellum]
MDSAVRTTEGKPSATGTIEEQKTLAAVQANSKQGAQDGDNKFQKAISAWRNIGLIDLIPTLDGVASDIVSHQRDSLVQRKDLAQKTKDFRKLDDAGKLGEVKGLLKSYQTFIDLLTNHSKSTSSAFLQVYAPLSEAPDPYPLLEASIESLVLSEDTLPKITNENKHLQGSVRKLTSQLEETEKRLEDERATRKALEDAQENKTKEVEATWAAVVEEKKDNWEAKERGLEEKVENQERLLRELKASYEVSQRLGSADDVEGEGGRGFASAAELEILNSDLERMSLRLAEVESRNEQLRLELAQAASHSQTPQPLAAPEDEPAFLRMRSENASLLRKVDAARLEKESEKRGWESQMRSLQREVGQLKADRDSLRSKTQKWSDYDEIKRELDMLKSIEFATGDEDEVGHDTDAGRPQSTARPDASENGVATDGKGETLEKLLLARNKKLSNELTVLRVSHQDLQSRLETMQERIASTGAELEKSRSLTAVLEEDLVKLQQGAAANAFPSGASVAGTYTSRYPQATASHSVNPFAGRRGRASPTSSIISGFDAHGGSPSSLEAIRAGEPVGGGSGILPMVTAQRDRFKQRNSQLEEELAKTYDAVSSLRQEVASLQKDNLDLYEKTRYVSTYNRGGQSATSSSSAAYPGNPNRSTVQMSGSTSSGLSLDRYRSAYEANISPFAAFRGRESARAVRRMSLPERVVFSITRMVLANRTSRNLFATYCFALHLLVLGMLYWMGASGIDKDASKLGEVAGAGAGAGAAAAAGAGALGKGKFAGGDGAGHGEWHQEGFSGGG